MKRLAILVSGKVQGVFFRASTKEEADHLGIKGFVRNEPNGDVYLEAEGADKALADLVTWCHRGPIRAVVNAVKVTEKEPTGDSVFEVRR